MHEVEADRDPELLAQRCEGVPSPGEAKLYFPGLDLMTATSSLTVLAGTEGLIAKADAKEAASDTGSKSRNGS